jgi:hypothetical protein
MTAAVYVRQNPPAEVSRKSLRLSSCLGYVFIRQKDQFLETQLRHSQVLATA